MAKRQHPGLCHSAEQVNLLPSALIHHCLVRPAEVACVYISTKNGNNAAVVSKHCSSLVEFVCEGSTVLLAVGVHGHCYCRSLHSPECKR